MHGYTHSHECTHVHAPGIKQNHPAGIRGGPAPKLTLEAPSVTHKLFLPAKTKHIGAEEKVGRSGQKQFFCRCVIPESSF